MLHILPLALSIFKIIIFFLLVGIAFLVQEYA